MTWETVYIEVSEEVLTSLQTLFSVLVEESWDLQLRYGKTGGESLLSLASGSAIKPPFHFCTGCGYQASQIERVIIEDYDLGDLDSVVEKLIQAGKERAFQVNGDELTFEGIQFVISATGGCDDSSCDAEYYSSVSVELESKREGASN